MAIVTQPPALREGPEEAGRQVFLEVGPEEDQKDKEDSCRPARMLACA